MKRRLIYLGVILLVAISCTKNEDVPAIDKREIQVEVVGMQSQQTRALLLNYPSHIENEGEFALNAHLKDGNNYFTNAWVYYYTPDNEVAQWRFRDVENQSNLINFYWPDDSNVNFVAYMPRNINTSNCACNVENISYDNTYGVTFDATLPHIINDITEENHKTENNKREFVYAARLNQSKDGGDVKLRFVHPFAAIKFSLVQSHRNLTINAIEFNGIKMAGKFSSKQDTYAPLENNNTGQEYLTYNNWNTVSNTNKFTINLNKTIPNDISYGQQIGGPYLIMPQSLDGVTISIKYTWEDGGVTEVKTSSPKSIKLENVPVWNPGNIYTYYLDLGNNKEEILLKVVKVEPWTNGEDDNYENNYDVK